MEKTRLWNCVHELDGLHSEQNSRYVLAYSNWNDFGYQTGFGLYINLPKPIDKDYNVPVAGLSIVEHYPTHHQGRFLPVNGDTNFTSFIMSIKSAERFYLFLTYDERMELIRWLNIRFDDSLVKNQNNYLMSTLRCYKRQDFLDMQKEIKEIVTRKSDVASLIRKYSNELGLLLR